MSATVATIRARVIENLRDYDRTKAAYGTPEYDQAIKGAYQILSARMPWPHVYSASGLTIAAGDTFTLSTNLGGDVRIRLRSSGRFLQKMTVEQLDALRTGHTTSAQGASIPYAFALWREPGTAGSDLSGRVYPPALTAQACDIFYDKVPTELTDGTLDAANLLLDTPALEAVILKVSSSLLRRMSQEKRDQLTLDKAIAAEWDKDMETTLYRAAMNYNNQQGVGKVQRWVSS